MKLKAVFHGRLTVIKLVSLGESGYYLRTKKVNGKIKSHPIFIALAEAFTYRSRI